MTPRIHLEQALTSGTSLELPASQSRHLQVLRLQPGSALRIFDGNGGEWHATVEQIGRRTVGVRVGDRVVDAGCELARRVTLAIGVPANDRMDSLIEKATELGVAAIQPLQCERSVLRLKGERAEARRSRWASIAAAASEQCGRRWVPGVEAPRALVEWLDALDGIDALDGLDGCRGHGGHGGSGDAPTGAGAVAAGRRDAMLPPVAAEPAAGPTGPRGPEPAGAPSARWVLSLDAAAAPPAACLATMAVDTALVVLSGPEGGLTEREEAAAIDRGFLRVGLGPRVLRADTAPLALLAWLGVGGL